MELSELESPQSSVDMEDGRSQSPASVRSSQNVARLDDNGDYSLLGPELRAVPWFRDRATTVGSTMDAILTWTKGPSPPRPYKIEPWLPKAQHAPLRLLDIAFPHQKQRILCLVACYLLWIGAFAAVLRQSIISTRVPGYDVPVKLSCITRLW